jgi:hypothetical protein
MLIVYEDIAQSSLTKIQQSTPCQILIKEGHFNLSTMLNLKDLWMYHMCRCLEPHPRH